MEVYSLGVIRLLTIQMVLKGCSSVITLDADLSASGIDNELEVTITPDTVTCFIDCGDDTTEGFANMTEFSRAYDTFGTYDILLVCFGPSEFATVTESMYIGTAITDADVVDDNSELLIPVTAQSISMNTDVTFNVTFVTGLDVTIQTIMIDYPNNVVPPLSQLSNGTHTITLPYAWFTTSALYAAQVRISNPLSDVNISLAFAVQEEIVVSSAIFLGYELADLTSMVYFPAGASLTLQVNTSSGEDIMYTIVLYNVDLIVEALTIDNCNGMVSTHDFVFTVNISGVFTFVLEVSNHVSMHNESFDTTFIYAANEVTLTPNSTEAMLGDQLDFLINIKPEATVSMGNLACVLDFDDGNTVPANYDLTADSLQQVVTEQNKEYVYPQPGTYNVTLACTNELPKTILDLSTELVLSVSVLVEEKVFALKLVHDSPNITYHPRSRALQLAVSGEDRPADQPLPALTCVVNLQGAEFQTKVGDVKEGITLNFTLPFSEGVNDVDVNCSKTLSWQTMSLSVIVYNDCIEDAMFDASYKTQDGPIIVYTHEDNLFKATLRISSYCAAAYYTLWTLEPIDTTPGTDKPFGDGSSIDSSIIVPKNTQEPGIYKLTLSINFTDVGAVISEFEYVRFNLAAMRILLTDSLGAENPMRMVFKESEVQIDSNSSVDVASGLASQSAPPDRTWTCSTGVDIKESHVEAFFASGTAITEATEDCTVALLDGQSNAIKIVLVANSLQVEKWYLFHLTMTKGDRSSESTQAILAKDKQPLDLTIKCKSNCEESDESMIKLTESKLELEISISTPVDNSSFAYEWMIERQVDDAGFEDISNGLTTDITGFTVPVSVLLGTDLTLYTVYKVSCWVRGSSVYADTRSRIFFSMNLPPYGGSCSFAVKDVQLNELDEVQAGLSEVCFSCSNWKDESRRLRRSGDDNQGPVTYQLRQVFLKNDTSGDVDEHQNIVISLPGSATGGCLTTVQARWKFPGNTVYEVHVADELLSPTVITRLTVSVIEAIPEVVGRPDNETAALVDALYDSTEARLDDLVKQNDLSGISAESTALLSCIALDTEEAEVIDITDPDVLNNVNASSVDGVLEDIVGEPVVNSLSLRLQETSEKVIDQLIGVVNASDPAVLANPSVGNQLLATVAVLAEAEQQNINTATMGKAVDVVSVAAGNIKNFTDLTPDVEELISNVPGAFNNIGKMVTPVGAKEQEAITTTAGAQKSLEAKRVFSSAQDLEDRENSPFSDDESDFVLLKRQLQLKYEMEEKKPTAMKAYMEMKKYEEDLTSSMGDRLSDGSVREFGTDEAKITLTRDAASALGNGIVAAKTTVKLDNIEAKGQNKITIALSEMNNPILFDLNGWAGKIDGQKSLIIDTDADLTNRISIKHKSKPPVFDTITPFGSSEDASGPWDYFQVLVNSADDDLNIDIRRTSDLVAAYNVYIAYGSTVSILNYVAKRVATGPRIDGIIWHAGFSSKDRPGKETGVWSVGVETILDEGADITSGGRKRRSVNTNDTDLPAYQLAVSTTACLVWENKTDSWTAAECEGNYNPDTGELDCSCRPQKQMTFANSFYVPPNQIDFSSVFLKFSPLNQAAVMATLIAVFLVYILIILWARWKDRQDLLKWGITPLVDNFAEDNYFYVIKVHTGMRPGSGTRSKVFMVVAGEEMDTGIREISDGVRKEFATGSVMNFLMSTSVYMGDMEYIRLWHDNSGTGNNASWYVSLIEIEDVQRNETFLFQAQRWLAVEKDDGLLECVLPVCKTENINIFSNRFFYNAKDNLSDSHLWVSVVYRPKSSSFTRCQRASCALVFIMLTMISNAMFFQSSGDKGNINTASDLQVGPFRFSLQQIYVSLVCAVIVTPVTLVLIYLFKMSRSKPVNVDGKLFKPRDRPSRYRIPFMHNWIERQQKMSIELEKHIVQKGYPNMEGWRLPHKCVYLAWFLVLVTCFLCSFFLMLYSMQWGKNKSEEWITTFLLSFFESVLCLDPVKVGIMALVFAIIFRSTKSSDSVINRSTIMKKYSSSLRGKSGGLRLPAPPLDGKKLEKAKAIRSRELLMKRALGNLVVNSILIWIVFSIAYSNRDNRSYYMHKGIKDLFVEPINKPGLLQVHTINGFFTWMNETVIPAMFPQTDLNGVTLHWRRRQFTEDGAKFRVGPPRLRQLRTKKQRCSNPYFDEEECFKMYGISTEDAEDYCIGWKTGKCDPKEEVFKYTANAWKFTSSLDIWGFPVAGYYTTYGGGGYIADLDVNRHFSELNMGELYENSWVDRQTRAVLLEFTLYCLNTNTFSYNMMMVEFPETGGAFPFYLIYPLKVYQHVGPMGLYTLVCEIFFILYLVILTIMIIIGIVQQKKKYFKDGWQVFDLVFAIFGYVGVAMYILRTIMTNNSLALFTENKKAFINFYHIALWNQMLVLLLGILSAMTTLRMLNVLGYNKRIGAVARVFSKAASDLFWFGIFFINVFTCYCVFGYLLFGSKLTSYRNVFRVMGTLFISMIGKSRFTEIDNTDPIMSKIYFIIFIFFVVYMILTMFLAMLSKAIDEVHNETKHSKEQEMVDYVIAKMRGFLSYAKGSSTSRQIDKENRRSGNSVEPAPPAPWSRARKKMRFLGNREILQDLRSTLNDALAGNARDFSTPTGEKKKKCKVSFRK